MRISDWSSDVCSSDLQVHDGKDDVGHSAAIGVQRFYRCAAFVAKDAIERMNCLACRSGNHGLMQGCVAISNRRVDFDDGVAAIVRSEEHTSELQSLMRISYAVFCLKKKI